MIEPIHWLIRHRTLGRHRTIHLSVLAILHVIELMLITRSVLSLSTLQWSRGPSTDWSGVPQWKSTTQMILSEGCYKYACLTFSLRHMSHAEALCSGSQSLKSR